jgi:hypothetical protein
MLPNPSPPIEISTLLVLFEAVDCLEENAPVECKEHVLELLFPRLPTSLKSFERIFVHHIHKLLIPHSLQQNEHFLQVPVLEDIVSRHGVCLVILAKNKNKLCHPLLYANYTNKLK